jgi:hypothetical protein
MRGRALCVVSRYCSGELRMARDEYSAHESVAMTQIVHDLGDRVIGIDEVSRRVIDVIAPKDPAGELASIGLAEIDGGSISRLTFAPLISEAGIDDLDIVAVMCGTKGPFLNNPYRLL